MYYDKNGNIITPESEKFFNRERKEFDFDAQSAERQKQILGWEAIADNAEEVLSGRLPTAEAIEDSRNQLETIEKSEDAMTAQAQEMKSAAQDNAQTADQQVQQVADEAGVDTEQAKGLVAVAASAQDRMSTASYNMQTSGTVLANIDAKLAEQTRREMAAQMSNDRSGGVDYQTSFEVNTGVKSSNLVKDPNISGEIMQAGIDALHDDVRAAQQGQSFGSVQKGAANRQDAIAKATAEAYNLAD